MEAGDFLLCTFSGDALPVYYGAEIIAINEAGTFTCRLPDTGQQFVFDYSQEPWSGTDEASQVYQLASHAVYTGGKVDPFVDGAAIVVFGDGKRFLAYVKSIEPDTVLSFYNGIVSNLTVKNNVVSESDWPEYPVGTMVSKMEGAEITESIPRSGAGAGANGQSTQFLFVDTYAGDLGGKQKWDVLVNTPKFYGAIIKATEGTGYNGGRWFKESWPAIKEVAGSRYGQSWFRGAYLFLKFNKDGAEQADYYLKTIDEAGGWDQGDIIPIIDVELGNDGSKDPTKRNSNHDATAQQIIDCTTACADRLRSKTGRKVMLYGRGAMRDHRIASKMGCDLVWNPSYTKTMVKNGLEAWTLEDIVLWQYCGDGLAGIDPGKLPHTIPGFGDIDISVYIQGSEKPVFETMLQRLGIGTLN